MTQRNQLKFGRRLPNVWVMALLRLGVMLDGTNLLSVAGCGRGLIYTTPVTLVEQSVRRLLVAPYCEVNWVRNAQAAGHVTLQQKCGLALPCPAHPAWNAESLL